MATFDNNTVTIEGRKLLMQSLVNGVGIEFTHFAIGDGAAPEIPENQTALVNHLFTVAVSKTQASDTEKGVTLVRGSFTNDTEKGDFYWRELGLYARPAGTDETPILFGYTNTGETADYVPNVSMGSKVVIGILLQVVTGSATVLYVSDPTARATMQDIDDCLAEVDKKLATVDDKMLEVDAKLAAFTAEYLASVESQIAALQQSINEAMQKLANAGTGYVDKTGDTMTGDLTMATGKRFKGVLQGRVEGDVEGDVTGDLNGSALKWSGWRLFSSIEELNEYAKTSLTEASTMLAIGQAMPEKSRLLHMASTGTVSADCYPAATGVLEIVKFTNYRCPYTFTSVDGHRWHSSIHTNAPQWKGWILSETSPVGTVAMYAGTTAPFGWLFCHGQTVSITSYPALYAVVGNSFASAGTGKFALPDFRGVFPRGYDNGRGIDSGRKWGTAQDSAAPNIKGTIKKAYFGYGEWELGGAFGNAVREGWATRGGGGGDPQNVSFDFDASRSSSVYKAGVNEIRPKNLAINFIIKY